jgi:3-oxoacyl-[acyl-carrier protein] reductase
VDLGIKGRRALLAGASAGMGKASALALAKEGVEIYISARGGDRLMECAKEIGDTTGVKVVPIVADHGTPEGRAALLKACPDPDILVTTCSPPRFLESYREIEPEEWSNVLSATFIGPVELMRATVGGMVSREFGRVVNITTVGAKTTNESRLLSGAPRAALSNYASTISKQVAKHNVAINNILPGMFHTAAMKDKFSKQAAANGTTYDIETRKWTSDLGIPAQRFGEPADVGALCAMLCSQYASYIIGQNIVIDGGIVRTTF